MEPAEDIDDRPDVQRLFKNLKASAPGLQRLLEECNSHWG
jgi:hypothetical protein